MSPMRTADPAAAPTTRYMNRMSGYLSVMYPPGQRFLSALLLSVSCGAMFMIGQGLEPIVGAGHIAAGWAVVFLLLLLLRLMDELKDKDVDEQLFPERPLPSGMVTESDIRVSIVITLVLLCMVFATMDWVLWVGGAVLLYAGAMFRFFFLPSLLKRSLPLTLVTHNPIVPLMLILLISVAVHAAGIAWHELRLLPVVLLIVQYWGMSFSWEVARKIRAPWQETAYVTYSSILGLRGAIGMAAAGQVATVGIGGWMVATYDLSPAYVLALGTGILLVGAAYVQALRTERPRPIHLRTSAERFMVLTMLAGLLEMAWRTF